jgi:hypothetical protein
MILMAYTKVAEGDPLLEVHGVTEIGLVREDTLGKDLAAMI